MPAFENLYRVELDRRRELREDAATCRAFNQAKAERPSTLQRLTLVVDRARGAVGLALDSLHTLRAAEER
jgi:hypothetical protein